MKKRRKREGGYGIKWKVEIKIKIKIKKERMEILDIWVYVCGGKKKTKTNKQTKNIWMKERKRIRNDHLKILPQYFHNKF